MMELVARATQAAGAQYETSFEIPGWGFAMLFVTVVVYMITGSLLRYTYGSLIPTLAMIETPTATAIIKTSEVDAPLDEKTDPDAPPRYVEQELLLVKAKPITGKFRTTIRHLRERAGRFSRFRGVRVIAIYHIAEMALLGVMSKFPVPRGLMSICVAILLCNLKATWTHVVISEPSTKKWYQRIPSRKVFVKLAAPTAIYAVAQHVAMKLPAAIMHKFHLARYIQDPSLLNNLAPGQQKQIIFACSLVAVAALVTTVSIVIPANVALKRVQASMLPEEDESIVPFDRTFGGKVVPEVVGGSGKIGMLEAWKTFDWNSRVRLLKIYAKNAAIQGVLFMGFAGIILAELQLVLGDQLWQAIASATAEVANQQ
ncbi:MAG: hypothetical protein MMC33_010207 [Icmadophila ericetorum]|nr:hypothetical protein [Icmadophila ericetorum]